MIKVGMIGSGMIAKYRHIPEYQANPNATIVAYYDYIPEKAEAMAKRHGGVACKTVEELLDLDLDAVSICSANATHGSFSVAALDKGKHVLCEKPMAISFEECVSMNQAAKRNRKILMIAQNQRLTKTHLKAKELIKQGEIGEILSFRTVFGHPGPEAWTGALDTWFFDKKTAAFGAMADLGVHKTDLIHFLTDDVITEVSAKLETLDKKFPSGEPITVDDNAFCIYKMKSGITGTMHVSWTYYGQEDNSTILYGTKGILRCYDDPTYSLILEKSDGTVEQYEVDKIASNEEQTSGEIENTGVIDAFVDAIVKGQPPLISGEDVIQTMNVIFAAEEAATKNKTIVIEENLKGTSLFTRSCSLK